MEFLIDMLSQLPTRRYVITNLVCSTFIRVDLPNKSFNFARTLHLDPRTWELNILLCYFCNYVVSASRSSSWYKHPYTYRAFRGLNAYNSSVHSWVQMETWDRVIYRATAFFDHAVLNVLAHQIIIETNCEYLALSTLSNSNHEAINQCISLHSRVFTFCCQNLSFS